jgi:hypothetical protein
MKPDFSGWATKNDLRCSDGRCIRKNAFKNNDGQTVPLVWGHRHDGPADVLGHAVLENRDEGVYAYCYLNGSESGQAAKEVVQHGDVRSLSIYANKLKQVGQDVIHGVICEVSLVLAGANPGAFIDSVMAHGDDAEEGLLIGYDENIMLWHSDEPPASDGEPKKEKTVEEIVESMSEEQKNVMYGLVAQALKEEPEDEDDDDDDDDEGGDNMKHNAFDGNSQPQRATLAHSDMEEILTTAKLQSVGSFQNALTLFMEQHTDDEFLAHGFDDIEALFPEYKDLKPGAPELITRDQGWVGVVMSKVHKNPFSRIRTKNMDARGDDIRAHGYQKGARKQPSGNMKLMKRTTDPQTVYITDSMHRDDIIDITDFDVVAYQYGVMKMTLNEEIAIAIMVGDGRDEGDPHKISEEHIRSIWNDDDLYTIHYDVDIEAARKELQGTSTNMHFGENYIYAEALVTAALYSREKFRGTGTPDLYCTPHLVNVMLLARDMNGRRIYTTKSDLAAALNVGAIHTVEQFEGLVRTDSEGRKHKLLGLFINLADYTVGATKGGEITRFEDFDINFNQYQYLIETRLSGALTRLWSAIALEEPLSNGATPSL